MREKTSHALYLATHGSMQRYGIIFKSEAAGSKMKHCWQQRRWEAGNWVHQLWYPNFLQELRMYFQKMMMLPSLTMMQCWGEQSGWMKIRSQMVEIRRWWYLNYGRVTGMNHYWYHWGCCCPQPNCLIEGYCCCLMQSSCCWQNLMPCHLLSGIRRNLKYQA